MDARAVRCATGTSPRVPTRITVRSRSGHFSFCWRLGRRCLTDIIPEFASLFTYSSGMYSDA